MMPSSRSRCISAVINSLSFLLYLLDLVEIGLQSGDKYWNNGGQSTSTAVNPHTLTGGAVPP